MGMFGYMTDTETVEPLDTLEVESEGEIQSQSAAVIATLHHSLAKLYPPFCFLSCVSPEQATTWNRFFFTS